MDYTEVKKPTIIIPYTGPTNEVGTRDIVVYLRPETNGVVVESILFKVIKRNPLYRDNIKMCYLANLPGEFIIKNKIVENHYSLKLFFAVNGRKAFTPFMKKRFENFFNVSFDSVNIVGAFEALKILEMNYEELFNIWVPENMMLMVNGQVIKKYKDLFIVNYDIPAILHKNNNKTDIAVMIFRSKLQDRDFHAMISQMADEFIEAGILSPEKPISRIFHYSKGPYEEILDSMGYLYNFNSERIELSQISFFNYLKKKGLSDKHIVGITKHSIVQFETSAGIKEESIFISTSNMSYKKAFSFLNRVMAQPLLKGFI